MRLPLIDLERYGCESCRCGGPRGFCHSCFGKGFDEDAWDKEDAQKNTATAKISVREQPGPIDGMTDVLSGTQITIHPDTGTEHS